MYKIQNQNTKITPPDLPSHVLAKVKFLHATGALCMELKSKAFYLSCSVAQLPCCYPLMSLCE